MMSAFDQLFSDGMDNALSTAVFFRWHSFNRWRNLGNIQASVTSWQSQAPYVSTSSLFRRISGKSFATMLKPIIAVRHEAQIHG